tara:strand:- start:467 stop:907 length:441 start_codon:yes stop_codon:yes gene_type:complete
MASLISDTERENLTGIFGDIFDTFKRDVVIYKEPKKIIQEINLDGVFGYGEYSQTANYTYIPVTGVYPAVIRYANDAEYKEVDEFTSNIPFGHATIKVEGNARDFIKNDKTEKITFDDKTFELASSDKVQRFLDSEYYIFLVRSTD